MGYCLDRNESDKFILLKIYSCHLDQDDDTLKAIIENAENWEDRIYLFSYFLSKILESYLKKSIPCNSIPNMIYELSNQMWIDIQEFDIKFLDYMLEHLRNNHSTLEENLIELQNDLDGNRYDKKLCD